MTRRWLIPLASLSLMLGTTVAAGTATAATAIPFPPANTAGYKLTGGTFSTVTVDWTQTPVPCPATGRLTELTLGVSLSNANDGSIEELNGWDICLNGTPAYQAWFVALSPKAGEAKLIKESVQSGDQFTATHLSGTRYRMTIEDLTQKWTHSVTVPLPGGARTVAEANMQGAIPLPEWTGTLGFSGFTVDGKPIGSYTSAPYKISEVEMTSKGGTACTSLSPLSQGEDFSVSWLSSCQS